MILFSLYHFPQFCVLCSFVSFIYMSVIFSSFLLCSSRMDQFKCPICLETADEHVILHYAETQDPNTSVEHMICRLCADSFREIGRHQPCPICRARIVIPPKKELYCVECGRVGVSPESKPLKWSQMRCGEKCQSRRPLCMTCYNREKAAKRPNYCLVCARELDCHP